MTKEELHKMIEQDQPNICQIEAIRDGKTVYSDTWNNYRREDCLHVMSVTKSVISLLVGIAIDKGLTDEFKYSSVCLHILSGILYKATGMLTVDYANKYLFEPLSIPAHKNFYAKSAQEHKEFTISKLPKETVWFADPQDLGTPGYGLCMTATDMVTAAT
ncbi:MAG: hypothetical protein J6O39_00425 [Treponema sp.]|nr:hypothetical protein [Treponema sp.]